MLFRETMVDPLLSRYSVIMVSPTCPLRLLVCEIFGFKDRWSAWKEHLHGFAIGRSQKVGLLASLSLAYLNFENRIRRKRPSLRLIISSATLDATTYYNYFSSGQSITEDQEPDVKIVSLEGRMYPVEIAYLQESTPDYVRKAAEVVMGIHQHVCDSAFSFYSEQVYTAHRLPEEISWSSLQVGRKSIGAWRNCQMLLLGMTV